MNIDLKSKSMSVDTATLAPQQDTADVSIGLDSFAMALSLQQSARQQNNATLSKALASSALLPKQSHYQQQTQPHDVRGMHGTTQTDTASVSPQASRPRADSSPQTRSQANSEQELSARQRHARVTQDRQAKGRQETAQDAVHLQQQRQVKQRQQQRLEHQRLEHQRSEQRQQAQRSQVGKLANSTPAMGSPTNTAAANMVGAQASPAASASMHSAKNTEKNAAALSPLLAAIAEGRESSNTQNYVSNADEDNIQADSDDNPKTEITDDLLSDLSGQDALFQIITNAVHFEAKTAAQTTSNTANSAHIDRSFDLDRSVLSTADNNLSGSNMLARDVNASQRGVSAFDGVLPTMATADELVAQRLRHDDVMSAPSAENVQTEAASLRSAISVAVGPTGVPATLASFSANDLVAFADGIDAPPVLQDTEAHSGTVNSLSGGAAALQSSAESKHAPAHLKAISTLHADGLNVVSVRAASHNDDTAIQPVQDLYPRGVTEFSVDAQENAALEAKAAATATTKPVPSSGAPALSNSTITISSTGQQTLLAQQQEAAKSVTEDRQIAGNAKGAAVSMSARLAQAKLQEQLQDKADDKAKDKIQQKLQDKAALFEGKRADQLTFDSAMLRQAKEVMSHDSLLASSFSNPIVAAQTAAASSGALTIGQNTVNGASSAALASLNGVTNTNTLPSSAAQSSLTLQAEPSTPVVAEPVSLLQSDAGLQLADRISAQVQNKLQSVDVKLAPEQLGEMTIRIELQQDQLSVQFVVQQGQAKELLEQHLPKLKEHLEQQGMQLAHSEVTQQDQSPSQGGQQERQQGPSVANAHTDDDVQGDATAVATARRNEGRVDFYA
jgi:flagellar hook-length control protein FliK